MFTKKKFKPPRKPISKSCRRQITIDRHFQITRFLKQRLFLRETNKPDKNISAALYGYHYCYPFDRQIDFPVQYAQKHPVY